MKTTKLVHVQANETLVMPLKILAAKRNKKMYELVDEALGEWLEGQADEMKELASLMKNFKKTIKK